ncbi:MAG: hypothetical protein KA885_06750 [Spirochaetes bacterium]|nr:hypothetical protein [Spirochaetota bacterium]
MILRDIITFFYNGIIKYGVEEFLNMIGRKLNIKKIKENTTGIMTHMIKISQIKKILFSYIIENLPVYV